jgi:hypothetical protein
MSKSNSQYCNKEHPTNSRPNYVEAHILNNGILVTISLPREAGPNNQTDFLCSHQVPKKFPKIVPSIFLIARHFYLVSFVLLWAKGEEFHNLILGVETSICEIFSNLRVLFLMGPIEMAHCEKMNINFGMHP